MYKIAHANLQKFMPSVCAKLYIEMRFRSHEAMSLAHAISGMSAFGTKRTCRSGRWMSALGGETDIRQLSLTQSDKERVLKPSRRRTYTRATLAIRAWSAQKHKLMARDNKTRR